MPYQCNDNEPMYVEKLGILKAIIDELDNTCYAIVGDWNANLKDIDNLLFANHMLNFCSENNFKMLAKGGYYPLTFSMYNILCR